MKDIQRQSSACSQLPPCLGCGDVAGGGVAAGRRGVAHPAGLPPVGRVVRVDQPGAHGVLPREGRGVARQAVRHAPAQPGVVLGLDEAEDRRGVGGRHQPAPRAAAHIARHIIDTRFQPTLAS